jgi:FPC/CPF motif-containing protein YcgG
MSNPDITSVVTKDGTDLAFPFLVLEAKSDKYTDRFEAIERQTSFPIRTMVKIRKDRKSVSTVPMDPLVWYVANRGDEWRVYACVPERSRIVSFPTFCPTPVAMH